MYAAAIGKANGQAVNVGDGTSVYKDGLCEICASFGLKGVGPREGPTTGEGVVDGPEKQVGCFQK